MNKKIIIIWIFCICATSNYICLASNLNSKKLSSFLKNKNFDTVEKDLIAKQVHNPNDPFINYNLGALYLLSKKFDLAKTAFSRSIKNFEDKPHVCKNQATFNLGKSYYLNSLFLLGRDWEKRNIEDEKLDLIISDLEESIKLFEDFLNIDPQHEFAKSDLANAKELLEKLKQKREQQKTKKPNDQNNNSEKEQNQQERQQQDQQQDQNNSDQNDSQDQQNQSNSGKSDNNNDENQNKQNQKDKSNEQNPLEKNQNSNKEQDQNKEQDKAQDESDNEDNKKNSEDSENKNNENEKKQSQAKGHDKNKLEKEPSANADDSKYGFDEAQQEEKELDLMECLLDNLSQKDGKTQQVFVKRQLNSGKSNQQNRW